MITTLTPMEAFKIAMEYGLSPETRKAIQDSREYQMGIRKRKNLLEIETVRIANEIERESEKVRRMWQVA